MIQHLKLILPFEIYVNTENTKYSWEQNRLFTRRMICNCKEVEV